MVTIIVLPSWLTELAEYDLARVAYKADIDLVAKGRQRTHAARQTTGLFDNLVDAGENCGWKV